MLQFLDVNKVCHQQFLANLHKLILNEITLPIIVQLSFISKYIKIIYYIHMNISYLIRLLITLEW